MNLLTSVRPYSPNPCHSSFGLYHRIFDYDVANFNKIQRHEGHALEAMWVAYLWMTEKNKSTWPSLLFHASVKMPMSVGIAAIIE